MEKNTTERKWGIGKKEELGSPAKGEGRRKRHDKKRGDIIRQSRRGLGKEKEANKDYEDGSLKGKTKKKKKR